MTDIESEIAFRKLTDAAGMYDRTFTGALPLDAFEVESMRPEEFKSNLKLAFNLHLTIPELTAIIKLLNKDRPEESNINCAKFLVIFMRLGVMERTKKLQNHWTEQQNTKDNTEQMKVRNEADFEGKNGLKVISVADLQFTENDREIAMCKLKEAAKMYVMQSTGTVSLRSFDALHMPPHEFKEQLRRVFKITLSSGEVGSLLVEYEGMWRRYRYIDLHQCCSALSFCFTVLYSRL